jgi:thiamine pyrophosphate-dependent acetolactate synthase large subunit-like protein
MLDRRTAITALLAHRSRDLAVVTGLGSATWDVASVGDHERNFHLWGAMGGAAMVGLGLALARPDLRIAVITGDGEMLMGLGSLATVGVQRPANLAIIVLDNGVYGETGMQASHTRHAVDLAAAARACGIELVLDVAGPDDLQRLAALLPRFDRTLFARLRITPDEPPRVLPTRDGVELKLRFRRAIGVHRPEAS